MQQTQWSDVNFKDNYSILKNKIITRGNYPKKNITERGFCIIWYEISR